MVSSRVTKPITTRQTMREDELEIVTLDSSLFLSIRNDLAFILDFRMHLYEHQSTSSPNMPLRDLFYVT